MGDVERSSLEEKNQEKSLLQDREGTDSSLSWADDVSGQSDNLYLFKELTIANSVSELLYLRIPSSSVVRRHNCDMSIYACIYRF